MVQETPQELPAKKNLLTLGLVSLLTGFLLLGLVLTLLVSRNRGYQVDEVENIHASYNMAKGQLIYKDFWQGHNPLLYYVLEPWMRTENPKQTFQNARMVMVVFLLIAVAFTALAVRERYGWPAASLAAGLLLFHTTFIERGMEVRADVAAVGCTMIALWLEVRGKNQLKRFIIQGLLLSLAFLFTQKAVFHCFAFGCLWLFQTIRLRTISLVVLPMVAWCLPLAMMALFMWIAGNWEDFVRYGYIYPMEGISGEAKGLPTFGPWRYILSEGKRNLFFLIGAGMSLFLAPLIYFKDKKRGIAFFFPVYLAVWSLIGLYVNRFPYPYSQVQLIPPFAFLLSCFLAELPKILGKRPPLNAQWATVVLFLILALVTSFPRFFTKILPSNQHQYFLMDEVNRITEPDDPVFDLAGLYFRPDAYPVYLMTGSHFARYLVGKFPPIAPAFRENGLVVYLKNYRINWLRGEDRRVLKENFIRYRANIYISGKSLHNLQPGQPLQFEVFKAKNYRYTGSNTLLVNGEPFTEGRLEKGVHELSCLEPIRDGAIRMITPEPTPEPSRQDYPIYVNFD